MEEKRIRVLEVNNTDLVGRIFNGHDLHLSLIKNNIDAKQIVLNKLSKESTVIKLDVDEVIRQEISYIERMVSVSNILFPYADKLVKLDAFKEADIVHYHFPYHQMFSILDYPKIMNHDSVWTIHDLWPLTGNCTHPLECEKWKEECKECRKLNDDYFPMMTDNVNFMWNIKKTILKKLNPHMIVASNWMKRKMEESSLTCHFNKVHVIPFGIRPDDLIETYKITSNKQMVIGFRAEEGYIKGSGLLYDALRILKNKKYYKLESVGCGNIPKDICELYETAEYGFIQERQELMEVLRRCDVFVMPSLAESFGMMAIEAMACKCVVICFEGTVIEENINAPECGISVAYQSVVGLANAIDYLRHSPKALRERQEKSYQYVKENFPFSKYVDSHIQLFHQIART